VYLHRAAKALLKAMVAATDQLVDACALFSPAHLVFAAAAVGQLHSDDMASAALFNLLQTAATVAHNAGAPPCESRPRCVL
jgi:hypothetical protein